ncbi:hypothetical protein O181_047306 [Austropuccinia psidii MF-1]|uniref:Reverse transcriptase Ty1/copia-type domain-containing protein n=1 Tax=Austropuccinia psidii MF-1 TaxID=1389203 RepID=A0A9Q3DVU0_9BASI|nr:hypothetical protein [Austropuccinia psidii MF-1]
MHSLEEDPKTYQQAMNCNFSDEWSKSIQTKLDNMERHCVWSPTTTSSEVEKALSTTWVFKRKTDEDGNLNKFKACLFTSLRLLLTLCHINNFPIEQMDVKCAFLNGKPDKELYIKRPDGYNKYKPKKYFKLNQSLYGLKQGPQYWHKELKNALSKMGLCPSQTNPCLFYSPSSSKQMLLYVHVDDLIFGGSWKNEFKTTIKTHFDMDGLGRIKYALGIRILQKDEYISLIQDKFINNILQEFQLTNSRHTKCPLPSNIKSFRIIPTKEISPPFNYQRAIGLLQYLVQCTRPDLAFSTTFLSQYLKNPKDLHYNAVKHVLTYLNSTKHYKLRLGQNILRQSDKSIIAFTDSDWGGSEGYKSFSASIIYYHGVIGWRSHKQKVVFLLSSEAKYNTMTEGTQDLQWISNLIFEITNKRKQQILYSDNQSTISIASNHIYHHGTTHVNFRLHFIRNLIEEENLKLEYLDTNKMIADSLTKNNNYFKSINHLRLIFGNQDLSSKGV